MKRLFGFGWLVIALFCLLPFDFSLAGTPENPNGERIKQTIANLSSDAMQGRETGSPEFFAAGRWLETQLKSYGLQPAGDSGSYIQKFTINFYKNDFEFPKLTVDEKTYAGDDDLFDIAWYSGGGKVSGEVVFVGYGIHAEELGLDEYKNIDVRGKIVLLLSGLPGNEKKKWGAAGRDSAKVEAAFSLGAKGMLFGLNPTETERTRRYNPRLVPANYHPGFIVASLDDRIVRAILHQPGEGERAFERRIQAAQKAIDDSLKPQTWLTGKKATLKVKVEFNPKKEAWNVLALLPGSDPVLKQNILAFGAHFDHVGKEHGVVYNGADDNASGTAVVLELARIFAAAPERPRRSLLFGFWGGEEEGLFGSIYFSEHPTVDWQRIVAYFNHDMVGLGTNLNFPGIYYAPEIWQILQTSLPKTTLDFLSPSKGGPGGSDHTPFIRKGKPAFALMTGPWTGHPDYHQPEDDASLMNTELLGKVAQFSYDAGSLLANYAGDLHRENGEELYIHKIANVINLNAIPLRPDMSVLDSLFNNEWVDTQLICVPPDTTQPCVAEDWLLRISQAQETLTPKEQMDFMTRMFASRRERARPIIGLRTLRPFQNKPERVKMAIQLGVQFIQLNGNRDNWFFSGDTLSAEGKNLLNQLKGERILFLLKDFSESVTLAALAQLQKPTIILAAAPTDTLVHAVQKNKGLLALTAELEGKNEPLLAQLAALKQAGNLECVGLFPLLDATHTVFQLDRLFDITWALKAAGWKEEEIRGVLGENANRVISEVFPTERIARRPR